MRSLSELFEYLSNATKEPILTDLTDHCDRLIQKNGEKSIRPFKFYVENLNTLFRLSELYLLSELPKMIEKKTPKSVEDEILKINEAAASI